jgi:hypothetical protein
MYAESALFRCADSAYIRICMNCVQYIRTSAETTALIEGVSRGQRGESHAAFCSYSEHPRSQPIRELPVVHLPSRSTALLHQAATAEAASANAEEPLNGVITNRARPASMTAVLMLTRKYKTACFPRCDRHHWA